MIIETDAQLLMHAMNNPGSDFSPAAAIIYRRSDDSVPVVPGSPSVPSVHANMV